MRGLPYDCSAKQVVSSIIIINAALLLLWLLLQIEFFNNGEEACEVLDEEGGVLFVKKPDGRATGDAFVLFKEETEGDKALLKHKEIIGSRYIELFRLDFDKNKTKYSGVCQLTKYAESWKTERESRES